MENQVQHLAIVMDGNRRWAREKNLDPIEGHREGINALVKIVRSCANKKIPYLTVYALSSENFSGRNPVEIAQLLHLMAEQMKERLPELQKEGAKIEILGDISVLPTPLQERISDAYNSLSKNSRIQINIALNYGGRAEILNAIRKLGLEKVELNKVNEEIFSRYLYTKNLPDPDLIIRTGGQVRISNFLLWQSAYSEWYFTKTLWPDFNEQELEEALSDFNERKRNFGK